MDLYVDGQARPVPAGTATLGAALDAVQTEMAAASRVITAVLLDGRELSPEEEAGLLGRAASEPGRVEVRSAEARAWGLHGLGEAASALGQIGDEFRAAADPFRSVRPAEALDRVNGAVSAYMQVIQALVNAAALARLEAPAGFKDRLEASTAAMRQMEAVMRAADNVAAADLVEYEIPEKLSALAELVREMSRTP